MTNPVNNLLNNLRAAWTMMLFLGWTFILVPFQLLYALVNRSRTTQAPLVRLWYKGVACILGLRIRTIGQKPASDVQHIYLGNHSSYIDIIVLGALSPPFFVAKADTADWPFFGFLIKIGGTIFISRKRTLVRQQMALFSTALKQGKHVFLFPEGTTTDGMHVLPFKPSLLNVLYEEGADALRTIPVAPVCIQYTAVNNKVFDHSTKDHVAWYADMELTPHLWDLFKLKRIDVDVTYLPDVIPVSFANAKDLSLHCHDMIKDCFQTNLAKSSS